MNAMPVSNRPFGLPLATAFRFAGRALRGTWSRALRGFLVFVACLALGVAAIAGVASLGRSFDASLAAKGDAILGGDVAVSVNHTPLPGEARVFLAARGRLSEIATLRAMARNGDGSATTLVEVKAVDAAYPLVGRLTSVGGADGRRILASAAPGDGSVFAALVEDTALARLRVKVGDEVLVGTARFRIAGVIADEPDRLSSGIGFGPRLMMTREALDATGLLAPGSLVRWHDRLLLKEGERAEVVANDLRAAFPGAGFEIRTRADAAPGMKSTIERFVQFLTLVGLTTLVIGGVGVANAVSGHLARRRETIAIWRSLGATGGFVVAVHAIEIAALALLGIAIGLMAGAAVPFLAAGPAGEAIGLDLVPVFAPRELFFAAIEGALVAALFTAAPLARLADVAPARLFRDDVGEDRLRFSPRRILPTLAIAAALVALVVTLAPDKRIAPPYLVALTVALVVLRGVGAGMTALARRLPRPSWFEIRQAIAALARPGAPTGSIVLSLGLGATLVAALVQTETSLTTALARTLPGQAPSFFFLDVPARDADGFRAFLDREAVGGRIEDVPMLRGRITALKGVPVEEAKIEERVRFVLAGDRGITHSPTPPPNSTVTEGAWWPADWAGEPLVSFDGETARGLGLAIGDTVTVSVLGRSITARVANLRHVEWDRLSINFFMVFSPNAFKGAPATRLVTVTWPGGGTAQQEAALLERLVANWPTVTAVRVREALTQLDDLVRRSASGISAVAGFTLIAAVLVLAGALAARQEARIRDAAILTALGATRRRLLTALALEFALVAAAAALFSAAVGTLAARWVVVEIMKLPFALAPERIGVVVVATMVVTVGLGLAATWRALGVRPTEILRAS